MNTTLATSVDKEKEEIYSVDVENLSLDELIAHVERKERFIEKRKGEVFKKVKVNFNY